MHTIFMNKKYIVHMTEVLSQTIGTDPDAKTTNFTFVKASPTYVCDTLDEAKRTVSELKGDNWVIVPPGAVPVTAIETK